LIIYLPTSFSSQQAFTSAFSSQHPAQLSPQQVLQLPSVQVSQFAQPAISPVTSPIGQVAQFAASFMSQLPQLSPQQSAQLPPAQLAQLSQPVAQQASFADACSPSQQDAPQHSAQLPPAQFAQFSHPLAQHAFAATAGWVVGTGASLREATSQVDESPRAIEASRIVLNIREFS
jgi:hypothetical protein